jgi:hypothetical protein
MNPTQRIGISIALAVVIAGTAAQVWRRHRPTPTPDPAGWFTLPTTGEFYRVSRVGTNPVEITRVTPPQTNLVADVSESNAYYTRSTNYAPAFVTGTGGKIQVSGSSIHGAAATNWTTLEIPPGAEPPTVIWTNSTTVRITTTNNVPIQEWERLNREPRVVHLHTTRGIPTAYVSSEKALYFWFGGDWRKFEPRVPGLPDMDAFERALTNFSGAPNTP